MELATQHEEDKSRALQEQRAEQTREHEVRCNELLADHAAALAGEKEAKLLAVVRAKKAEARANKIDAALAQATEALELLTASANKSHANNAANAAELEATRDDHAKALAAAEANAAKAKAHAEALEATLKNTTDALQAHLDLAQIAPQTPDA